MAPIVIRAFRVIALYEQSKFFLSYLRNRYVTLGLLVLSTGIGISSLLEQSNVEQRNQDGYCLLFYHYYFLLSVFILFLSLMSLVSVRIFTIRDTYHVATELFGHLLLGFFSGLVYCLFLILIDTDLIKMNLATHVMRPNYYISCYGAMGMYLSFLAPLRANFYRRVTESDNEELSADQQPPDDDDGGGDEEEGGGGGGQKQGHGHHKTNSTIRNSLIHLTSPSSSTSSPLRHSQSQSGGGVVQLPSPFPSSNPILIPQSSSTGERATPPSSSPSSVLPMISSSFHRLTYAELMNISVDELLQNSETRLGLQTVARNALCPELISFLIDVYRYQQQIDSYTASSSSSSTLPMPIIPSSSYITSHSNFHRESSLSARRSQSISNPLVPVSTPAVAITTPALQMISEPQPQTRTSRSNSFFGLFAPLLAPPPSASPSASSFSHHPLHSASFSFTPTGATTMTPASAAPPPSPILLPPLELELIYRRYLDLLRDYIDDNATQEVNISMAARHSAKEIKLKPIFFQCSRERMREVFERAVREVHSVIKNNLYGDLRRYTQQQQQQQQQQRSGGGSSL
jgi:hypothetical protein